MQDSIFVRRILSLLIGAIFLAALLTLAFYYFVTSDIIYTNVTANDFRRKGSILADRTESWILGETTDSDYEAAMMNAPEMLSATLSLYYFQDDTVSRVITPQGTDFDDSALAEANSFMLDSLDELRNGQSVEMREKLGTGDTDALIVGYPVEVFDRQTGERAIRGAIFISKSIEHIRTGYDSLNFALIFASGLSILIMIVPTYLLIIRLIRPLNQVKDVAIAMSNGNFTLRADTRQPGEIGELALAINDLAGDLDRTISALMQERNRLRQILDGLNEGIIAVDRSLRITHANQAASELLSQPENFRYARTPRSSMNSEADVPEEEPEQVYYLSSDLQLDRDYQQVLDTGKDKSRSFPLDDRVILLTVSPLSNENEEVIGAVGLIRDVTASEKLEQTRRDYIANVSHELRTPLTALRGLIEPLADGLVSEAEDQHRYYSIILNETLRLSRLIDDMLELSRLQAGRIALKRQRFDIREVIQSLEHKYESVASEKGLTFVVPEYDPECPPAYSNMDRIEQVLVILLDNAIKFTDKGGIIELGVNWDTEKLILSVKDTGSGIAAEDQAHIFERFYKTDKSRGRAGGTGLGLSIAREMMEQMGERIWVRSHPDQGSTFFITINKYRGGI